MCLCVCMRECVRACAGLCLCEHACDPNAGSNKIIIYLYYSSQHYERKIVFSRPVARGVQGVLENPPFYEPPFLENMNPPT